MKTTLFVQSIAGKGNPCATPIMSYLETVVNEQLPGEHGLAADRARDNHVLGLVAQSQAGFVEVRHVLVGLGGGEHYNILLNVRTPVDVEASSIRTNERNSWGQKYEWRQKYEWSRRGDRSTNGGTPGLHDAPACV